MTEAKAISKRSLKAAWQSYHQPPNAESLLIGDCNDLTQRHTPHLTAPPFSHFTMANLLKIVLVAFVCLASASAASYDTNPPNWTPDAAVTCTWTTFGKDLDCDGVTFIFEAQDKVGTTGWWLDMGLVGLLIVFAGTIHGIFTLFFDLLLVFFHIFRVKVD